MKTRRELLGIGAATLAAPQLFGQPGGGAGIAPRRLVFVHGRAQQKKDPQQLKVSWIETLNRGGQKIGKHLSDNVNVAFPYYGDLLDSFATQFNLPTTADIQTKGAPVDAEFLVFQAEMAEQLRSRAGVTDQQVETEYGNNPKERGPQNWEWVQAILRALDKKVGGLTQNTLETFMRDVFLYTRRASVRDKVDAVVVKELTDEPTLVVAHSLGTVVAYSVLSSNRPLRVPLYVTVGSPLGIKTIRDTFRPVRFPTSVSAWYNAFDDRDVVALYPLDNTNFPVTPQIENYSKVKNSTDNRHGIVGYLDDAEVAKHIFAGLA
jgi:hypothetical protein